jgi:hypothetical protein
MATQVVGSRLVADVKCYYCGHVSGQIVGRRNEPLRIANFVPRQGYQGPDVRPGTRLRCERCQGPVFLEDTTNVTQLPRVQAKAPSRRKSGEKGEGKAA